MATLDAPLVLSFTRRAVLLGARPPDEVVAGAIGCFWRLAGNEPTVFGSPEEFLSFTDPGFAKAVVGFRFDARGAEIHLTTETRFVATDEATQRLMNRYWLIIRPGSNLIRTELLRAIRRRALSRPNATPESTQILLDSGRGSTGDPGTTCACDRARPVRREHPTHPLRFE